MQLRSAWQDKSGTLFDTEKSAVTGTRGVVAANHPLASAAGLEMLALGGNAIDAAVATLFTLNVVEPMMVGLFGAGWTNIRLADGRCIILDNYSTAPAAGTLDLYTPIADTWPNYMETARRQNKLGYLAVGVPLPRVHLGRYGGCLAPHSSRRGAIIPTPRQQGVEDEATDMGSPRWSWARLLKRVFALEMARCPWCPQGALRIIAALMRGEVIRQILRPLQRAADPPLMAPARLRQQALAWPFA